MWSGRVSHRSHRTNAKIHVYIYQRYFSHQISSKTLNLSTFLHRQSFVLNVTWKLKISIWPYLTNQWISQQKRNRRYAMFLPMTATQLANYSVFEAIWKRCNAPWWKKELQLTNVVFVPSKLVNGERFCASLVEFYSPNRTHGNINIMSFQIGLVDFPASTFINRKVPRLSPAVIFVSVRCMVSTPRRIWTIQLIKCLLQLVVDGAR